MCDLCGRGQAEDQHTDGVLDYEHQPGEMIEVGALCQGCAGLLVQLIHGKPVEYALPSAKDAEAPEYVPETLRRRLDELGGDEE